MAGFNAVGGMEGLWEKYPLAVGKSIHDIVTTNATMIANSSNISTTMFTTTAMTTLASNITNISTTATTMLLSTTEAATTGHVASCYSVEKHWDNMFR